MRRIAQHRQVRQRLQHRDRRDVHRVARVRLKGADAPLAQHQVIVAAGQDVLGAQQQLFNRGRDAALQQHRLADPAKLPQQVEVLHVARAHLETVHIGQHRLNLRDLHHLANHQQARLIGSLTHDLQPGNAHSLERVRRRPRFVCAAAQKLRSRRGTLLGTQPDLLLALHRARTAHDHDLVSTNHHAVGEVNARALRPETPPCQLVR